VKGDARGAARRYARALLDVATVQKNAEPVRGELRLAQALLADNPELARVLGHPGLPAEKRKAILAGVLAKAQVGELTRRLLGLLLERGLLPLLPEIERLYSQLWNAQRGVVAAEAVSAVDLEPAQAKALEAAIAKATGRGVELTTSVEPAVVGGLLVKMAGRVYDGTVRAQLRALRERLTGASHT